MTFEERIDEILSVGETETAEFKRKLTKVDLKRDRKQKLVTRIRFMTHEDPFEGQFLIGIEDIKGEKWEVYGLSEEELKVSEDILKDICDEAEVEIIVEEQIETEQGLVGIYLLKRTVPPEVKETCSINIAGRVNSGKSTLVGALVTGTTDNGSGKTRSFLLTHPQEITRGQTADIHHTFMGFTEDDDPIHLANPLNKEEGARVLDRSAKILSFFDAPGHKEFSKTMIRSILGGDAQYGMILVPVPEEVNLIKREEDRTGNRRLDEISREHLILMSSQDIPFIVVTSKVDKANEQDIDFVLKTIRKTLKEIGKIPVNVREPSHIPPVIKELKHGVVVPIVPVAATEMKSLNLLLELLKQLPSNAANQDVTKPARAYIDKVYRGIRGTNVVVTGTVKHGVFKTGQLVMLGPNENGKMMEGRLFSIEMFKKRVNSVKAGDLFGFDIKNIRKLGVRRGQVVSDTDDTIKTCREFEADIVVTRHPTRISLGYTPVFQSNTVQHTVIFKKIYDHEFLSVGDFARVRLAFMTHPEAVEIGDKIVLREANTRAIGTIVDIVD